MPYKFLDYAGLEHVIETIKNRFVQKVAGKDLSTNDFTDANKTKLNGIETGAQVNTVNKVNDKTGDIILNSDDISFTSSKSGSTPTTTRAIIDSILDKDIAQDAANAQVTNRVSVLETDKADKSYTDTELGAKADKTTTYTKTEVDGKLSSLDTGVISVNEKTGAVILNADDIDDTATNNKFVSAAEKTTWNGKANVSYVDTEVGKKVDKVTGKGLSTNDFTTTLKDKLDGIDSGAQTNVIEIIKRNGTNLTVTGKAVDIRVPTKLSDLTNDRTFQTEAQIKSLISEHGKLKKEIVTELPTLAAADENTMYLTQNQQNTGYEEWMAINGKWEILGDTAAVDFTGYIHEDDISLVTTSEIDTMFAAV